MLQVLSNILPTRLSVYVDEMTGDHECELKEIDPRWTRFSN